MLCFYPFFDLVFDCCYPPELMMVSAMLLFMEIMIIISILVKHLLHQKFRQKFEWHMVIHDSMHYEGVLQY